MSDLNFIPDLDVQAPPVCINCHQQINTHSRFCSNCGIAQIVNDDTPVNSKFDALKQVALFFLIDAIICSIASFIDFFKTFEWSVAFDVILAIVAIFFFASNWSKLKQLLTWRSFSPVKLLGYCAIAVVASIIVSAVVGKLNQTLLSKEFSYYAFYASHKYAKVLAVLFIAVMPALFEELGYRGFTLGKLSQVVDVKQAGYISAFLFAIMHMSFLSLFWLIPFALFLSYVRIKEGTIWYGVCIHFSFNLTVCVTEIISQSHIH